MSFNPDFSNWFPVGKFRFWCQKVLPLVYDDSLSYYEVLCKVVDYLNKYGEDLGVLAEDYNALTEYVNHYFDDGVPNLIMQYVNEWLDDHPEATTTVQDWSLTNKKLVKGTLGFVTPEMFGAKGDGLTDDTQAIQDAINFVAENEIDSVLFSQKYVITHIHVKSNVNLIGIGGELIVKDNFASDSSVKYYVLENIDENNVTYKGLSIDGNAENNSAYDVCDLITCMGKNSNVIGCVLKNCIDSGIMFSKVEDGLCIDNIIDGARDIGIYINDSSTGISKGSIVSNNIITNCTAGGIAAKRATKNITVSNNSIRSCGNGITLEQVGGTDYSSEVSICNNYIEQITNYGINIRHGAKHVVCGNTIIGVTAFPILVESCEDSIISNNYLESVNVESTYTYKGAIRLTSRAENERCVNIAIIGNVIKTYKGKRCFSVGGDYSSFTIDGLVIANNIFNNNDEGGAFLLAFSNVDIVNSRICDNIARYDADIGLDDKNYDTLYIANADHIRIKNTRLVPHSVAMQQYDTSAKWGFGVRLINPIRAIGDRNKATYRRGDIVPTCENTGVLFYYATADGLGSDVLKPMITIT